MSEQAIYSRLNSEVTALGGRIYPMVLPQNVAYPAVTYQRISATRHSSFGVDDAPVEPIIQVDIYGRRDVGYGAHVTVADAVRSALQRYRDESATPPIYDIFIEAERDDYEDDTELYRKSFDLRAWYRES